MNFVSEESDFSTISDNENSPDESISPVSLSVPLSLESVKKLNKSVEPTTKGLGVQS